MAEKTLYWYLRDLDEMGIYYVPQIIIDKQRDLLPRIVDSLFVAYVSGALTGVSEEMKERYVRTKQIVEYHDGFTYVPHINGTDPIKHPDVIPRDVRDIDHFWAIAVPDFQITWTDPASIGSGIEAGWGEEFGYEVPIICLYPSEKKPTRLLRGLRNYHLEISYENFDIAYNTLDSIIDKIQKWRLSNPRSNIIFSRNVPFIMPRLHRDIPFQIFDLESTLNPT